MPRRICLLNALPYHPFLIKPNNHELGEIFDVELGTRSEVISYAGKLKERGGAERVSFHGRRGSSTCSGGRKVYEAPAPEGVLINGVGAGDSMVAGFMAGYMEKEDYEYAFHMGLAAGSASAFSEYLATKEEILQVYDQVKKG